MHGQILDFNAYKAQRDTVPPFNDLLKTAMDSAFEGDMTRAIVALNQIHEHHQRHYDMAWHKCQIISEARVANESAADSIYAHDFIAKDHGYDDFI